jgi:hypothetical protein
MRAFLFVLVLVLVAAVAAVAAGTAGRPPSPETFSAAPPVAPLRSAIPPVLWTFWHDAADDALPALVRACIASWKRHNPSYEVRVVTPGNLARYLPGAGAPALDGNVDPAHRSDQVRVRLLARHGGIWMDASLLCTAPLDWVHAVQRARGCEVVGFSIGSGGDYPVLENWFLACVPGAPVMRAWAREMARLATFPDAARYVDDVRDRLQVRLERVSDPLYLTMHVAAQVVFQKQMTPQAVRERLYLFPAEKGPFAHLAEHGWDQRAAFEALCGSPPRPPPPPPLIKLRGTDRAYLEAHPEADCIAHVA